MIRKILAATAALTLGLGGVLALAAPASAGEGQGPNHTDKKVTICHATASVTNPYVVNWVNDDAVDMATKGDKGKGDHNAIHNGPIFDPNGGKDQPVWGDIIPPFYVGDNAQGSTVQGKAGSWPSKNWTEEGQAIWRNGCNLPVPEVPVEVTPMADTTPATCDAAGGISTEDTYYVTYSVEGDTVTATLQHDAVWPADLPSGWTGNDDGSVSKTLTVEAQLTGKQCDPNEPPVDPEDPKDPEEPNNPNPPQNQPPTELPGTGASDVLPWAGLGIALLLSGLLTYMVTSRRRSSSI